MATERWDPWRDMLALRETMERMFQESLLRPARLALRSVNVAWFPVDLGEKDEGYLLRAPLPGARAEDVDITLQGDVLTIRARAAALQDTGVRWLAQEIPAGQFERSIPLPGAVDVDRVEARVENGLLTLELPRAAGAQARRIRVAGTVEPASESEDTSATVRTRVKEDVVNHASEASFPASDPPSWTPGEPGARSHE